MPDPVSFRDAVGRLGLRGSLLGVSYSSIGILIAYSVLTQVDVADRAFGTSNEALKSMRVSVPASVSRREPAFAASTAAGMPVIVFVHGRGQKNGRVDAIRNEFVSAFRGVERALVGTRIVPDSAISFVWYADVIDPSAEKFAGDTADAGCRGLQEQSLDQQRASTDWRDRLMQFAKEKGLVGDALQIFATDTFGYLSSRAKRCQVEARFDLALQSRNLQSRPLVVVAHSMGGIVSFAAIQSNAQTIYASRRFSVLRFVTLATQVGTPLIQEGIQGSFVTSAENPITIASWTNFVNSGDLLAFPVEGVFHVSNAARAPRDLRIAFAGPPHSAVSYLSNVQVARSILFAWCGGFVVGSMPKDCQKVRSLGDV